MTDVREPTEIPAELDRWNWGAFLLNWIWGIDNNTFIALLTLVPGLGIIMMFVLGQDRVIDLLGGSRVELEYFRRLADANEAAR